MIFKYLNYLLLSITIYLKDQMTNNFVQIDDFCKEFDAQIKKLKQKTLDNSKKRRNRTSKMSDSEINTCKTRKSGRAGTVATGRLTDNKVYVLKCNK